MNAIVLTDWIRGTQMDLAAHGNIQWIALFATLMILFYVLSVLKGDGAAAPTADSAVDQATGIEDSPPLWPARLRYWSQAVSLRSRRPREVCPARPYMCSPRPF